MSRKSALTVAGGRLALATLGSWLAFGAHAARADEGDACVLSYEQAQVARKKGDMVGAKEEITLCQHACPMALSKDCDTWLPLVQAGLGKISLAVNHVNGSAVPDATLFVDGVQTPLGDGQLEVNLGGHAVRVEASGMQPASANVTVGTGAPVRIQMVLQPRPSDAPITGRPAPTPVAPFVVGGLGLGVAAVGGALGIVGQVDVANMRATCGKKAQCSPARVQVVREEWIAGAVLAGVGGGAVVVGIVLLATEKPSKPATPKTSLVFVPSVDPANRSGGAMLTGTF